MGNKKNNKNTEKSLFAKLLCLIFGVILIILPLTVFTSLFGYDAADPSFNKVSSTASEVHNFLGKFGSYSADAVLSTFGLSLIIFLVVPIFWGIGLCKNKAFPEAKMRIFAWFVGVLSLACFIDLVGSSYLGTLNLPYNLAGEWSRVLSRPLSSYINNLNIPYNTFILEAAIFFVSVTAFNFAAGVTFRMWAKLLKKLLAAIKKVFEKIWSLFRKAANIKHFSEFKELNPSYLSNKMKPQIRAQNVRREPEFERTENISSGTLNRSTSLSLSGAKTDDNTAKGLTIEIPQIIGSGDENKNSRSAAAHKQTVSPTFDFMNGEIQNKETQSFSAEDIYQSEENKNQEKVKSQSAGKSSTTSQTNKNTASKAKKYVLPDINFLSAPKENNVVEIDENVLKKNAELLEKVLNDFGIRGQIVKVRPGPVVTLYELEPAPGTRTARVIGLSDDIARSMSVASVRMAVVSGHNTIGIELPNEKRQTVWLRELLDDKDFRENKNILNVALGKDIGGQHVYADLSRMPHLLVAGTTGSGKSVGVNSMILSLLYRMTPEQCRFIMIDPKQLEFSMYNGIPHLLTPVITDPAKAVVGLKWAVQEMENRYRSMALLNVRNIAGYNKKVAELSASGKEIKKTIQTGFDKETGLPVYEEQVLDTTPMPYIVVVVDEMADLMLVAGKEVEAAIQRLAQMARAAGIHLIMSTQRPSVDVITGVIKANFPSRISFHVTTKFDSATILGEKGAEQLLGMGDMLYMPSGMRPIRVHGCFVPDEEVEKVAEFIKNQGEPQYVAEVTAGELNSKDNGPLFDGSDFANGDTEEELYQQAVEIVRADKKASTSYIQRKLRIGYNRAANLIDRMEREGVVSKQDHVGRREVLGVS